MKKFFKKPGFKVLICVLVLLAGFMAYAGVSGQITTLPGQVVGTVLSPFQRFGNWAYGGISRIGDRFMRYGQTQNENDELRAYIAELEQQLVELDAYRAENEQLREFYDIKEAHPEWDLAPAFVVGRDTLAQFGTFTIDQGSVNGIGVGDVVISSSGSLVGVVVDTGPVYASVRTILDPAVSAAAMVSTTRDSGLAGGDPVYGLEGLCVLTGLPRDTAAEVGDRVVTTGLGEAYPKGLLVGTITEIVPDAAGMTLTAVVEPTEDVGAVRSVMVIRRGES